MTHHDINGVHVDADYDIPRGEAEAYVSMYDTEPHRKLLRLELKLAPGSGTWDPDCIDCVDVQAVYQKDDRIARVRVQSEKGEAERKYDELIRFRVENPLPKDACGEIHHIRPRSIGGSDGSDNLVKLTPGEHYKAHALLPYVMLERHDHDGYCKMLLAWNMMSGRLKSLRIDEEAEEYDRLRRRFIESRRGHQVSTETRQKIREKLTGRKASAESRANQSKARKGKKRKPFSAEWRANIGKAARGRKESPEQRAKVAVASRRFWAEWRKYGSWDRWYEAHPEKKRRPS